MVINFFMTLGLIIFGSNLQTFRKLLSCSKFMDHYEPVKLLQARNRDTGKSLEKIKWF